MTLPEDGQSLFRHAIQLQAAGRHAEAIPVLQKLAVIEPQNTDAHYRLGFALLVCGKFLEAAGEFRAAIALQPDHPHAHDNLGAALLNAGEIDAAIDAFRQATLVTPEYSVAHYNLGTALSEARRTGEAILALKRAFELAPQDAAVAVNLAHALSNAGRLEEAIDVCRAGLSRNPRVPDLFDALLMNLHYPSQIDPSEIFREHVRYGETFAPPTRNHIVPHSNSRDPDRKLRVGYVSADFRQHAVASFIEPVLAGHDREKFEVFCYSNVARDDAVTTRMRGLVHAWRDIFPLPDDHVAAIIGNDSIDVLVDLSGHTSGNRLGIFALKPAPVQVTYLGYPNTTGVKSIDYRITDAIADPPGQTEALHVETLWRLPQTFLCYHPPENAPALAPLPAAASDDVTFGSFNNVAKANTLTMQLWARLLQAVPRSRLVLKSHGFADEMTRDEVRKRFEACGIEEGRISVLANQPSLQAHLAMYERIDIALDCVPYNGTTTTCEALWMGVPVVTLVGNTHASRVGLSLLTALGLSDLCARDENDFVAIATRLATERERLRDLRDNMRQRMTRAPLMDRQRFTHDLETAYRQMWRAWCAST